jgi:hypothetical protein
MEVRKGGMNAAAQGVTRMRHALEFQQGEEQVRKNWCVDEINTVEKNLDNENRNKKDLEEKIELMAKRMERLRYEIKQMNYAQEDADIELEKASMDRRKANTGFQQTVANQFAAKKTLKLAMSILESVWGKKNKKASLLRKKQRVQNKFTDAMGTMKRVAQLSVGEPQADLLSWQNAKMQQMKSVHPGAALLTNKRVQKKSADAKETMKRVAQPSIVEHQEDLLSWQNANMQGIKSVRPGAALLQNSAPKGNVSKMLNVAAQDASDAEALIKAGQAMAHPKKVVPAKAMMQQEPAGPPPPPGLKKYGNAAAGGGVLTMLENLQEDAQAMVDEAVKDETEAMKAYEVVVAEANKATDARQEGIADRRAEVGKLEEFTQEAKISLSEVNHLIATLRQHDIDLYGVEGCSYLIKNYAVRYVERDEEINSLKEAEAVLGVGGGDPKMAAATHADGHETAEPDLEPEPEAAGVEEEEPEPALEPGESKAEVVPEGIKIEFAGPQGPETAVSKMVGAK